MILLRACPAAFLLAASLRAQHKIMFFSYFNEEKLEGEAEAEAEVRAVRRAAVAVRNSAAPGNEVPAATTDHAVGARDVVAGVIGRRLTVILFVIPVLTPFQYVAAHVVGWVFLPLLSLYHATEPISLEPAYL